MTSLFATAATAVVLAAAFGSTEASARVGGFAPAGAHAGVAAGFHAFHGQPSVRVRPAPLINHGSFARFGVGPRFGFHRFVGNGFPLAGGGVYYGGYDYSGGYEPPPDAAIYQQPIYVPEDVTGTVPSGNPSVVSHGTCRSDTHVVPSEAGGERKVTVTRCY
jgi:hypothetical protein